MIYKLRHIFIFICVFSVFSLTLQASIINAYKDSKVFKNQNQSNPVTEEEEESHDSDQDEDEVYYLSYQSSFSKFLAVHKLTWLHIPFDYKAFTKAIQIPPPKQ